MTVDPATLQIFANHCAAAAESMGYTLMRTAHSTFVKETEDFSCQILHREGLTVRFAEDASGRPGSPGSTTARSAPLRGLPRRRHLPDERPLQRLRGHAPARHASVEAGFLGRRTRLLRRMPYPQHRHRGRRAGVAFAHPHRSGAGGYPHSADQALRRRPVQRGNRAHLGSECPGARSRTAATSTPRSPA